MEEISDSLKRCFSKESFANLFSQWQEISLPALILVGRQGFHQVFQFIQIVDGETDLVAVNQPADMAFLPGDEGQASLEVEAGLMWRIDFRVALIVEGIEIAIPK